MTNDFKSWRELGKIPENEPLKSLFVRLGYSKEDIVAGLCKSVVLNYLNNVGKGKKIEGPIVFQGGVSKNIGVKKAFEDAIYEFENQ